MGTYTTKEQKRVMLYERVSKSLEEMGKHVLMLIRHPDATPEHLVQAREAYAHAYSKWWLVRGQLQERHPGREFPWNKIL